VDELKKSGYGTTSQPLSLTTASLAESIAKEKDLLYITLSNINYDIHNLLSLLDKERLSTNSNSGTQGKAILDYYNKLQDTM